MVVLFCPHVDCHCTNTDSHLIESHIHLHNKLFSIHSLISIVIHVNFLHFPILAMQIDLADDENLLSSLLDNV